MKKISYRDDDEPNLNPEEKIIKNQLLDSVNESVLNEYWKIFLTSVHEYVNDVVDDYVEKISKNTEAYKKQAEVDAKWQALTTEEQNGPKGAYIENQFSEVDRNYNEEVRRIKASMMRIKTSMIEQILHQKFFD